MSVPKQRGATNEDGFSALGRARSMGYALRGIGLALRTEHNLWIHSVATVTVCVLGWWMTVSALEWCALVFAIVLGFGLSVTAGCSPSEKQTQAALEKLLKENPKILQAQIDQVLKEKGIRGRPPQKSIDDMMKNPIKVGLNNAPTIGAEDAEITIVEFSDFQCPFCNRVVPTMKQLLKDYDGKSKFFD